MLRGAIHAKHAVDQDADPVGDPLDVGEDVRAEEDTSAPGAERAGSSTPGSRGGRPYQGPAWDRRGSTGRDRARSPAPARRCARWPCESRRIFVREGISKWSRIWSSRARSRFGMERAAEANGLGDGHPAVERMPFRQVGDPAPHFRRQCPYVVPKQLARSATGLNHAQKHPDRRRLAGTVAAEETINGARPGRAGSRRSPRSAPVIFGEPLRCDGVGHECGSRLISSPPAPSFH